MGIIDTQKIKFAFLLLLLVPLSAKAWSGELRCARVFEQRSEILSDVIFDPTSKISKQEFYMNYRGSESLEILRVIVDVFYQYPRQYLERGYQEATLAIPESKWMEIFKRPFEDVVEQLLFTEVYKVSTFENGFKEREFQNRLVSGYGIRTVENIQWKNGVRQIREGEPQLYIRLDQRLLDIMNSLQEPSFINRAFEDGFLKRKDYQNPYLNL